MHLDYTISYKFSIPCHQIQMCCLITRPSNMLRSPRKEDWPPSFSSFNYHLNWTWGRVVIWEGHHHCLSVSLFDNLLESEVFCQHDFFFHRLRFHFQPQGTLRQFHLFAHCPHHLALVFPNRNTDTTATEFLECGFVHINLVPSLR